MDRGDVWTSKADFTGEDGQPADPTTVSALVRAPDGTIETRGPYPGDQGGDDVERVDEGSFTTPVTLADSGEWNVRWEGTGAVQASSPDQSVDVADSVFYPGYKLLCSVDAVIKELKLTDKQPDRDRVEQVIEAASHAICVAAGRNFYLAPSEPSERTYPTEGSLYVPIKDAAEVTAVAGELEPEGQVWTQLPVGRDPELAPVTAIVADLDPGRWITVEARWGWPIVNPDIREAAIKQAAAWYGLDSARLSDSWGDELSQAGAPATARSSPGRSLLAVVRDLIRPYRFVAMG